MAHASVYVGASVVVGLVLAFLGIHLANKV